MVINSDNLTTITGSTTILFATAAATGLYPQYTGFLAALSHFLNSYMTNKR